MQQLYIYKNDKPGWPNLNIKVSFALKELEDKIIKIENVSKQTEVESSEEKPTTDPPIEDSAPKVTEEKSIINTSEDSKKDAENEKQKVVETPKKEEVSSTKNEHISKEDSDKYYALGNEAEKNNDEVEALNMYEKPKKILSKNEMSPPDEEHIATNDSTRKKQKRNRIFIIVAIVFAVIIATVLLNKEKTYSTKDKHINKEDADKYYALGEEAEKNNDEVEALKWFRKAADAGNANAMFNVGAYYSNGLGGLEKDEVEALKWVRKAAEAGNASAMCNIGWFYQKGLGGLKKDEVEALKWYRKAADAGDEYAIEKLKELGQQKCQTYVTIKNLKCFLCKLMKNTLHNRRNFLLFSESILYKEASLIAFRAILPLFSYNIPFFTKKTHHYPTNSLSIRLMERCPLD